METWLWIAVPLTGLLLPFRGYREMWAGNLFLVRWPIYSELPHRSMVIWSRLWFCCFQHRISQRHSDVGWLPKFHRLVGVDQNTFFILHILLEEIDLGNSNTHTISFVFIFSKSTWSAYRGSQNDWTYSSQGQCRSSSFGGIYGIDGGLDWVSDQNLRCRQYHTRLTSRRRGTPKIKDCHHRQSSFYFFTS